MKIKLDIDGVLRNMIDPMLSLYNRKYGTSLKRKDVKDYDVSKSFPLLAKDNVNAFKFFFVDNMKSTLRYAKPYRGAAKAVQILREKGNNVTIVTYQPSKEAQAETYEWLKRNNIQYDSLIFTNTPTKKQVDCDIIIDDCCDILNEEKSRQTKTCCITHAYNRKGVYTYRYNTLLDFVNKEF